MASDNQTSKTVEPSAGFELASQDEALIGKIANFFEKELDSEEQPVEKEEQPKPVAQEAEEEEEQPDVEEEEDEVDSDDESDEPDDSEPEPDSESDGDRPENLQEIAEALGTDTEAFMNEFTIPVQVNGETHEVSLNEARLGYMRQATFTQNNQALSEQRKAFETQISAKQQELSQAFEIVDATIQAAAKLLDDGISDEQLKELRAENPAEWSALLTDRENRAKQLKALTAQIVQEQQKVQKEQSGNQQAEYDSWRQAEAQKFFEAKPELDSTEKVNEWFSQVGGYLMSNGVTEKEISELNDHRQLLIAEKAMLYDQMMKKANVKKSKAKKVPKILKSNAPKSQKEISRKSIQQQKDRLRQSGDVRDAAPLFEQFIED